ncbi:hypothetical protein L1987_35771 [Smallanthus sonchifolius]|uniref:Uncharacterized protein n=1 Tax=Smallanthus sonchifolius TaxID=185202 RepID=A0ACB9HCV1_9ASTR|nr:hypothetical protein L1987_35771 [Smallanthus sonchifolius]
MAPNQSAKISKPLKVGQTDIKGGSRVREKIRLGATMLLLKINNYFEGSIAPKTVEETSNRKNRSYHRERRNCLKRLDSFVRLPNIPQLIDVGEGKCRQVVSGLAKYCSPDELTNRLVALITNVKPGKLRDVVSEGLVLCASNADHTVVEPLIVPEGAKFGECVTFSGHEGKPEDVLNPKKKQLDKITPNLFTDDKGVATFKGVPFMTSAGPCISAISNASIK